MEILGIQLVEFLLFIGALLIALTFHEASHALVAYYLGDFTAKLAGRVTLNPIKHLDPIGSLIFLLTQRIGWGKPVPVNPQNFKHPVRDNALTALAGPMSNFLLAFAIAMPLKYLGQYMPEIVSDFLWLTFHVNIFLGVFNLLPFPPLDGSGILGLVVPRGLYRAYQNYLHHGVKYFIVIIVIDAFILGPLVGFSFFGSIMQFLAEKVRMIILLGV